MCGVILRRHSPNALELAAARDVLADIVIARACPELFGTPVIMFQWGVDYCF